MQDSNNNQVVMPVWSNPLGQGPHPMERAEMLTIECMADIDELRRITPSMCEPSDNNIITVFFTHNCQPPNSLGFSEVGLIQEVLYKGKPARTIPYIWVSDDMALLGGRDLFGMPKLMMDDNPPRVNANQVFGKLARNDVTMMEGSMVIDRRAAEGEFHSAEIPTVFERHIPNPNPAKPSLKQLIMLEVQNRRSLGEIWVGHGHIEVRHPLHSRLDLLGLKSTGRAWFGEYAWDLPCGDIVEEVRV